MLLVHLNSPLINDAGVIGIEPCSDAESSSAGSLNDYIPCSNKEGSFLADIWHTQRRKLKKLSVSTLFPTCTIVTSSQNMGKSWEKSSCISCNIDLVKNIVHVGEDLSSVWTLFAQPAKTHSEI